MLEFWVRRICCIPAFDVVLSLKIVTLNCWQHVRSINPNLYLIFGGLNVRALGNTVDKDVCVKTELSTECHGKAHAFTFQAMLKLKSYENSLSMELVAHSYTYGDVSLVNC